jgi:RNA polymerase sigma-70 factor (ECF subfamily)
VTTVPDDEVVRALRAAAAEESAQIVATVVRITDDWDLAEDCLQDAFARALATWPVDGVPRSPGAWLTTVAKNRAIDQLRHASAERRAVRGAGIEQELEQLAEEGDRVDEHAMEHDRLALLFTCCHPALAADARVALTLRTVVGMTIPEIARAFLVSESTMDKRLVRARAKIRNAGIPFRVPEVERWPERMPAVLAVLYLLFSEGYSSTESERFVREPIAREAIRLQRMLMAANSDQAAPDPEIVGLLALMLFQHARRRARATEAGELVVLEEQDRGLWDATEIAEGRAALDRATRLLVASEQPPGQYYLLAAIAAGHSSAPTFAATDFERIVSIYDLLAVTVPSPVVELNRAVAIAMARGPAAGLELVDRLAAEGELDSYYLLHATRADLLRRLGRRAEALPAYERAHDLAPSPAERRYLRDRMAEVREW